MKKHYKGLTVLLSACMLAGSASVAYAGPADDIANGTVGMPNAVRQHRQSSSTREPGSRMRTRHFMSASIICIMRKAIFLHLRWI